MATSRKVNPMLPPMIAGQRESRWLADSEQLRGIGLASGDGESVSMGSKKKIIGAVFNGHMPLVTDMLAYSLALKESYILKTRWQLG